MADACNAVSAKLDTATLAGLVAKVVGEARPRRGGQGLAVVGRVSASPFDLSGLHSGALLQRRNSKLH